VCAGAALSGPAPDPGDEGTGLATRVTGPGSAPDLAGVEEASMPDRRALRVIFELALTLALVAGAVTLGYAADPPPASPQAAVPQVLGSAPED
jgi:hypothetical protein